MATLCSAPDTIYGPPHVVRRLRAMARGADRMAARIARIAPSALYRMSRTAGIRAEAARDQWGTSHGAADHDPSYILWWAMESALRYQAGRSRPSP